jgi:hypothetical protein
LLSEIDEDQVIQEILNIDINDTKLKAKDTLDTDLDINPELTVQTQNTMKRLYNGGGKKSEPLNNLKMMELSTKTENTKVVGYQQGNLTVTLIPT